MSVILALLGLIVGAWHVVVLIALFWLLQRAVREGICQAEKWFIAMMLLVGGAWTALLFSGMAKVAS